MNSSEQIDPLEGFHSFMDVSRTILVQTRTTEEGAVELRMMNIPAAMDFEGEDGVPMVELCVENAITCNLKPEIALALAKSLINSN